MTNLKGLASMVLLLALLSFQADKQIPQKHTDLKEMHLSGAVKTLTDILYKPVEIESDFLNKTIRTKSIYHFNKDGNITDDDIFNHWLSDTHLMDTILYDENGNRSTQLTYNDKNEFVKEYAFVCNEKGEVMDRKVVMSKENFDIHMSYQYDEKGNKIAISSFSSNGDLISKTKFGYKYDSKDNIIVDSMFSKNDSLLLLRSYKLDNMGNIVQQNEYSGNKKLTRTLIFEYKYDNTGNWIIKKGKVTFGGIGFLLTEREIEYYK